MKAKSILKVARLIPKSRFAYLSLTLVLGLIVGLVAASPLAANGDTATICGYDVTYNGVTYNPDGTSTWSYTVKASTVTPPAKGLSHWVLGLCVPQHDGEVQEPTDPDPWTQGTDPHTGVTGIKWDYEVPEDGTEVTFTFTLSQQYKVGEEIIGGKAGNPPNPGSCLHDVSQGTTITGPDCDTIPTAVTLSSFAAKASTGGLASPLWLGLAGLTVLAAGSLFWIKRRAS